jgi:hypothetical protein
MFDKKRTLDVFDWVTRFDWVFSGISGLFFGSTGGIVAMIAGWDPASIFFAIIGSAAAGSITYLALALFFERHKKTSTQSLVDSFIFIDCSHGKMPDIYPSSGEIWAIDGFPGNLSVGLSKFFSDPGAKASWPKSHGGFESEGWKCTVINHGEVPLFRVKLPVEMGFQAVKKASSTSLESGDVISKISGVISIPRLNPGEQNAFVFYFYNPAPAWANLRLGTHGVAEIGGNNRPQSLSVKADDFVHGLGMSLTPRKDDE